jgi:hypothetical protein
MSNEKEQLDRLAEIESHIEAAIRILQEAERMSANYAERGTMESFRGQLAEMLNCDHGEGGLQPYITARVMKYRASKKNIVYNREGKAVSVTIPTDDEDGEE